jgi:hypothetical protein
VGAGKSQAQKGDPNQQVEKPLGVKKPKSQEAMQFAQVITLQPVRTGELASRYAMKNRRRRQSGKLP